MNPEWNLHYFRRVIGDGEPERHVGDVFDWFSVGFWSDAALIRAAVTTKTAVPIADSFYRVSAKVVYVSRDPGQAGCILDFGIRAIADTSDILPAGCVEGEYVSGMIRLELPLCTGCPTRTTLSTDGE